MIQRGEFHAHPSLGHAPTASHLTVPVVLQHFLLWTTLEAGNISGSELESKIDYILDLSD